MCHIEKSMQKKSGLKMSSLKSISCIILLCLFLLAKANEGSASRRPKADQNGGQQNCTNHLQIIDRCSSMATYSYTSPINKHPVNEAEMRASCDRINEGLKCLRTHGKCLGSVARRSLTSYSGSRSRHSKSLCSNINDPNSVDFVKANECIQRNKKTNLMIASEKELITTIKTLAKRSNMRFDERFHHACCAADRYKSRVLKDAGPECSKFHDSIEGLLDSMAGELLESACPETKRLQKICSELPKLDIPKEWQPTSWTSAALELIVSLAENPQV